MQSGEGPAEAGGDDPGVCCQEMRSGCPTSPTAGSGLVNGSHADRQYPAIATRAAAGSAINQHSRRCPQ